MFGVYHEYYVDGGFGDAVPSRDLVGLCSTKEEADEYVLAWDDEYVYDVPYSVLTCGALVAEELGFLDIRKAPEIANPTAMPFYRRDHSNEVKEKES